ncbi:MAG TPA: ABC transporter permease [Vicinamibacterales bacterium]|nr:ABC transporter permease [Vicinamibacterales bacterium]
MLDRLLRRLVRMLPAEFRSDFGQAIESDLAERRRSGDRTGLVSREVPGLVAAVIREHAAALRQDTKYAFRMMRRTPGFTLMAVLMLACGTGLNAAMFSIVDAVLLTSPFERPEEIVALRVLEGDRATSAVTPDKYRQLVENPGPLSSVGAYGSGSHVLTGQGYPISIDDVECVTPAMFGVFETRPWIGRVIEAGDDQPGAAPVIVLSHEFWRELGGSPAILHSALTINATPVTVIGVMPKGFAGPLARADVQGWMPRNRPVASPENAGCRGGAGSVIGRLRPGTSIDAARQALPGFQLEPIDRSIVRDVSTPFTVLMVAVSSVLLIACFNVGGLQMERTLARRREMAVRLALGAGLGRLVRQTLTENVILAGTGAIAGVLAASAGLKIMIAALPANLPYIGEIAVNGRVLAMAALTAGLAGIVAGLLPVFELGRFAPARDLKESSRATGRQGSWARRALVVTEIAVSIVVLISASLMVQTFLTLRPSAPGFDPAGKLLMSVRLRGATPEASAAFFAELRDRMSLAPAIAAVEGGSYVPMGGTLTTSEIEINGQTRSIATNYATPGFFSLLKVQLAAGRLFSAGDTRSSPPVVVVNRQLAQRLHPEGLVLGRTLLIKPAGATPVVRTIVGVVEDMRSSGVSTRVVPEAYVPYAQNPTIALWMVAAVRAGRDAEAALQMREAVHALRPELVVTQPRSYGGLIYQRMGTAPFGALLLGAIAAIAVGLSAIGLMATIGWWVRQRTRELGVRMALGATARGVTSLVLSQGLTIAAIGIAVGCAGAAVLTKYLSGWIYGVTPLDLRTFAGSAAMTLVVSLVAIYFPARAAVRINPVNALKSE